MQLHANCVALGDIAVLISGESGVGKTTLCLELISKSFQLVADDRTNVHLKGGMIQASAPEELAGLIELPHIGIVKTAYRKTASVICEIELVDSVERLPEVYCKHYFDTELPQYTLPKHNPANASAVHFILRHYAENGELPLVSVANHPQQD